MSNGTALPHLEIANRRRVERAAYRREVQGLGRCGGCDRIVELLQSDEVPPELASAPIATIVQFIPWFGVSWTRRVLLRAGGRLGSIVPLRETRRLDSLSPRERNAVAAALREIVG